MLVHVFTAKRYHLVPKIVKGFATTYSEDAKHFFILNGDSSLDVEKYHHFFSSINCNDYLITKSKKELASALRKYRKNHVLFHAGKYYDFLIAMAVGCKLVDWVCWGGDASISKSSRTAINTPLRRFIYNKFNRIITLMDGDRNSIIRDFKVPPEKIITISYASSGPKTKYDDLFDRLIEQKNTNDIPVVLLGNSPHNIMYYMQMLPYLAPYSGKIKVRCMNQYSLKKDDHYFKLLELGKKLFGDDFQSDEDFYNYDEYLYYMNRCDIYICSNESQTGLGAIGVCMQLGKKIFIHGKNLEWINEAYEGVVYDTEEIISGMSWEDFSKELPSDIKKQNLLSVRRHRLQAYLNWKEYLRQI